MEDPVASLPGTPLVFGPVPQLVGREPEERLLAQLLAEARAGTAGVIAFVGDVGIGKSSLLEHAVRSATGMRVLRSRGIQSEARIPFGSLLELLRPALGYLDAVAPRQREALESALALRPARAGDRFAVGAATLALLAAYAEEAPLLVAVDDAQWLDGSTADALLFAMRRLVADPVAVVLSVRRGTASLLDGADLPVHELEGLDADAVRQLVAGSVSDALLERLHRGTGGNPLALLELPHDVWPPPEAPLPIGDRLAALFLDRYRTLPPRTQDLLLLASASEAGDLSLLARAATPLDLAIDDIAPAEDSGLVFVSGERLEFRHPLARSAIYVDAPAAHRRAMHRALADALPDVDADRRAWHLALATVGPDEAASSALEQAASRARARSAYDVASHAYERAALLAAEASRRSTLLLAAADSAWLGGLLSRAVALLDGARHGAPPDVAMRVAHLRGHLAARLGPLDAAQELLLAGAAASDVDADAAIGLLAEAVSAAFYAGDPKGMRLAASRIQRLTAVGERASFLAALACGMASIFAGDDEHEGAALLRRAVGMIEGSTALGGDPRLLAWAAMGPLWLREAAAGHSLVARALDAARSQSSIGVLPFLLSHVAVNQAASDRWPEAEASFHGAIGFARETGQRTDLAFALGRLGLLEARQGREDECRRHVEEARTVADELGAALVRVWCLAALGELGLGRPEVAARVFTEQQAILTATGIGDVDLSPDPEVIELDLRRGRRADAEARLAAYQSRAEAKGQPWALARAARCRGLLAPDDEIGRHFEEALALHDRTPDGFEAARTRLAYGGRLRRAQQRVRAREELRAASEVFDALRAQPWSEAAARELAATGQTARRRDPSTQLQLSPQELQISLLLADGLTTRDAAAALFLSPKTIEYHLRSVYRKLGIRSRPELREAMTRRP